MLADPELHCSVCNVSANSVRQAREHLRGRKHAAALEAQGLTPDMDQCLPCSSLDEFDDSMLRLKKAQSLRWLGGGGGDSGSGERGKGGEKEEVDGREDGREGAARRVLINTLIYRPLT